MKRVLAVALLAGFVAVTAPVFALAHGTTTHHRHHTTRTHHWFWKRWHRHQVTLHYRS